MTSSMDSADLLALDWGTTSVRAYRLAADGTVVGRRHDDRGASKLTPDAFRGVLEDLAASLDAGSLPVIACGMAGSKEGWAPAPYLPCPVGLHDLARAVLSPPDRPDVRIVPGLCLEDEGLGDVMRGEEIQALGVEAPAARFTVLAPGTHSKWIRREGDRIVGFRTFLTGELFAAVRDATLMGRGMATPGQDDRAFLDGVRLGFDDPALTATLFQVRVRRLAGTLDGAGAADLLSGLLVGAEMAGGLGEVDGPLVLVGTPALTARYALALEALGRPAAKVVDAEVAVAAGLHRLWRALS